MTKAGHWCRDISAEAVQLAMRKYDELGEAFLEKYGFLKHRSYFFTAGEKPTTQGHHRGGPRTCRRSV